MPRAVEDGRCQDVAAFDLHMEIYFRYRMVYKTNDDTVNQNFIPLGIFLVQKR